MAKLRLLNKKQVWLFLMVILLIAKKLVTR